MARTKRINALFKQLAEYVLDDQSELENYIDYCNENELDPEDYASNTDHVFAVAKIVYEECKKC